MDSSTGNNGISVETPLIYSHPLSSLISRDVYLKLEIVQPSGSFKLRGISEACIQKVKNGCTKLVGSSGGNAGLALAYSAMKLKVPCQLYVPTYVDARMLEKIKSLGAETTIAGKNWHEANEKALEEASIDGVGYVHPFDDPILWEAYSAMVTSTKAQLNGKKPSAFVVSVGGGGMLCGILRGLEIAGWKDIPVVAIETEGCDSFNASVKAGKLVNKPPTSIAKTLGANSPVSVLMEWIHKYRIISHVLTDKEAVNACIRFADDHGMLVEYSCGASLAAIYSNYLPGLLDENGYGSNAGPIVIIVCGGSDVTPQMLIDIAKDFDL